MGGLYGDIVTEFTVSRRTHTGQFDHAAVDEALDSLDQQMDEFFARMNIAPEAQMRDYGFRAVRLSLHAMRQITHASRLSHAASRAALRVVDRVPPLKRWMFARMGED